jgi:hypothetical protein
MTELFERASRARLRFETPRGTATLDDLWSLPLQSRVSTSPNLDDIAMALSKQLRTSTEPVSFVEPDRRSDPMIQLAFDVVKRIIEVRVEERKVAELRTQAKERDQKILAILNDKENEGLRGKSAEELLAMLSTPAAA